MKLTLLILLLTGVVAASKYKWEDVPPLHYIVRWHFKPVLFTMKPKNVAPKSRNITSKAGNTWKNLLHRGSY